MTDILQSIPAASAPAARSVADLRGPAGRLEAIFAPGRPGAPYAAVVAHPHPLYGGTMHNKVVYHAAKAFQHYGLPVLRFNFRGAGASEGRHDGGEGEQQDLAAALRWLADETRLPILAAGFSFGAYVMLRTCCGGSVEESAGARNGDSGERPAAPPDVRGAVALGLPIQAGDRGYSYGFLRDCTLPKLLISGAADEFGPVAQVEAACALAKTGTAHLIFVAGADHFFQGVPGGLQEMQAVIRAWLEVQFQATAGGALDENIYRERLRTLGETR